MEDISALKKMAYLGGLEGVISLSSSELAEHISVSPQTAARRLQSLEQHGYITRQVEPTGQKVSITARGRKVLELEYLEYRRIFNGEIRPVELSGNVITGLGEGQYYISQKGYSDQFVKLLGFEPYPGTLNIKLDPESKVYRKQLNQEKGLVIYGFSSKNRTFGGGRCYPVSLGNGIRGAIMIPDRTHYPDDIIEIISPQHLRERLKLEDGSRITITLQ